MPGGLIPLVAALVALVIAVAAAPGALLLLSRNDGAREKTA